MAVSEVSICNLALTMLSTSRINSLTEDSENARKCNAVYTYLRDGLLTEHDWNFARAERELSSTTDDPELSDNWTEVHQVPADCLRIIRAENDYPFARFGDKVYSNTDSLKIEYVKKVTDPTLFSSGFVNALAARIAMVLSFGITQNATIAARMIDIEKESVRTAKFNDAQEGIGNYTQSGSLIEERML